MLTDISNITSGTFGVPLPVVAQALFDALIDFDMNCSPNSCLKEIHIVDVIASNMQYIASELHKKWMHDKTPGISAQLADQGNFGRGSPRESVLDNKGPGLGRDAPSHGRGHSRQRKDSPRNTKGMGRGSNSYKKRNSGSNNNKSVNTGDNRYMGKFPPLTEVHKQHTTVGAGMEQLSYAQAVGNNSHATGGGFHTNKQPESETGEDRNQQQELSEPHTRLQPESTHHMSSISTISGSPASSTLGDEEPMDTNESEVVSNGAKVTTAQNSTDDTQDKCPICFDPLTPTNTKKLERCKHIFCKTCITKAFAAQGEKCPVCQTIYGKITGTQPQNGEMSVHKSRFPSLPGHEGCGTITIRYTFPGGKQSVSNKLIIFVFVF